MLLKDSLLGLGIILIWGFNFVIIAWGVEEMPPLFMGAARFVFVACIGALLVKPPRTPWYWLASYAFVLCFGQFALLFMAMSSGMPAGLASLVLQSQALFTVIFSALFIGEKINASQLISLAIAGVGLYFIGASNTHTVMTGIGFTLTIAAASAWAVGNIINRLISQKGYQADIGLVVWSAWFAIIPFFIASYVLEGPQAMMDSLNNLSWRSIIVLLYLSLAASIIGYSKWSYLLSRYPAGQVAPLTLGVPAVGIVSAMLFLDETISTQQVVGITLVMVGLVVNTVGGKFIGVIRGLRAKHL